MYEVEGRSASGIELARAMVNRMVLIERLYAAHAERLLGYLRRRFAGVEPAEDLLQETFARAAASIDRLDSESQGAAWLFGIARNVGLSAARRRRAVTGLGDVAEPAGRRQVDDERLDAVRAAMDDLPDRQRETLELRVRDGLTYTQIAVVLSVPVGTVRSRIHHAVRRLRDQLTEEQETR